MKTRHQMFRLLFTHSCAFSLTEQKKPTKPVETVGHQTAALLPAHRIPLKPHYNLEIQHYLWFSLPSNTCKKSSASLVPLTHPETTFKAFGNSMFFHWSLLLTGEIPLMCKDALDVFCFVFFLGLIIFTTCTLATPPPDG